MDSSAPLCNNKPITVMPLSSYRMQRIYVAATMNYGLGSNDPKELAYYTKIRKEMDNIKKESVKKGVPYLKLNLLLAEQMIFLDEI